MMLVSSLSIDTPFGGWELLASVQSALANDGQRSTYSTYTLQSALFISVSNH